MRAVLLGPADRPAALERLARRARENLWLLDLVAGLGGRPSPGEAGAEVLGAYEGRELRGLLALRPCVVSEADLESAALESFRPYLDLLQSGLLKCPSKDADAVWRHLAGNGCRRVVDRVETQWALAPEDGALADIPARSVVRPARNADLPALVDAARASLREEGRPDPYELDPDGFRRWVRGRLGRAHVVEERRRIVFVGYADVQRPEGWLLQGVYTWPEHRRNGHARTGVSALCRLAFAAGADHVQLAVVAGNAAAEALYRGLGFRPALQLRTVLFEGGGR